MYLRWNAKKCFYQSYLIVRK